MRTVVNAAISALVIGVFVLAGCDPVTHPSDPGRPLWTLRGAITNSGGVEFEGDLRAAFIWMVNPDTPDFSAVATDLPIEPVFPFHFTVDVFEAPPEEVFFDSASLFGPDGGGVDIAAGLLVVYEDGDGDGVLDLMSPGATAFTDQVLGTTYDFYGIPGPDGEDLINPNTAIIFVRGDESISWGDPPREYLPGLNIVTIDFTNETIVVSPEATIELDLMDDLFVRVLACERPVDIEYTDRIGPIEELDEVYVAPDRPVEMSAPDFCGQRVYDTPEGGWTIDYASWCDESMTQSGGVCGTVVLVCSRTMEWQLPCDVEPPEDWPCPIETDPEQTCRAPACNVADGWCCEQTSPEEPTLRITTLLLNPPGTLDEIQYSLVEGLDNLGLLWLLQVDLSSGVLTTGAGRVDRVPPATNDEFCNVHWDGDRPRIEEVPIDVLGDTFSTAAPIAALELPVFTTEDNVTPRFVLTLTQVELEDVTLDPDHTVVGFPVRPPDRPFMEPSASLWAPGGTVRAWIDVEAAREVLPIVGATLCGLLSGDLGDRSSEEDDCASPMETWPNQPSEIPGTAGVFGWQLEAGIGAGAVTIVN